MSDTVRSRLCAVLFIIGALMVWNAIYASSQCELAFKSHDIITSFNKPIHMDDGFVVVTTPPTNTKECYTPIGVLFPIIIYGLAGAIGGVIGLLGWFTNGFENM